MAPDVGAVTTTPERRDPTASAVARPVNKAPARRAVDAAKRRALRASASGEQLDIKREDRSRQAETRWGSVHMWTAPDLQGLVRATAIGSLALICPAFDSGLRPLAKMGFANSEIQTRERHLLPVNRAETLPVRLAPITPPLHFLQVPP